MHSFITDDFLLNNTYAKDLYHSYAKDLPIIDYHNHLSPVDIASNRVFENLSQAWLEGDHYKWRAMRTIGVNEAFITGQATDKEKFLKWADTVPYTIRNPLFHWTHLELLRYFDISDILKPEKANTIYNSCNEQLQDDSHHTLGLLKQMSVDYLCTTDDPIDSLIHHRQINSSDCGLKVFPSFRPDKSLAIGERQSYTTYLDSLGESANVEIRSFSNLLEALSNRIDYFHDHGARISDHGLSYLPYYKRGEFDSDKLFQKFINGQDLSPREIGHYQSEVLRWLSKQYHKRGWTQQFHLGAIRNNNKRLLNQLGPDTGFDSIGDYSQAEALSQFLNDLDATDQLTKTIVYNLNPADNEVMAAMVGNFNDGSIKGKIQYGAAWWFLDQKDGIEKQLNALSNMSLLSCSIGMLTDSRSFLSFPRHEYFRRILCNLVGRDIANGELPTDIGWLGNIISDVCYNNVKGYLRL